MEFTKIIEKKRFNQALTKEEINYWMKGYTDGTIPDYQCAALLMAICCNGMNDEETFHFTVAMKDSGESLDFSSIDGVKGDKHSSGGVGDKTSMALMPLVASCGLKVAKMSGPGLGFCGGTVDKLSSIPGMNVYLSQQQLIRQVKEIGIAMCGQTENLCPADKKIYALRDTTATVGCLPLIVSSIMCKKIACGDDVIELEVTYGKGSFTPTKEEAIVLGEKMMDVGRRYGRKMSCCITNMDQPLGLAVGNALEVKEAIDTLHGKGPKDFTEMIVHSGVELLTLAGLYDAEGAEKAIRESMETGKAAALFQKMIAAQGGGGEVVDDTDLLPKAEYVTEIKADKGGYINELNAKTVGECSMSLGAGKQTMADVIDYAVGIVLNKKISDGVQKGDTLAYVHHNKPLTKEWTDKYLSAYVITDQFVEAPKVVDTIIR